MNQMISRIHNCVMFAVYAADGRLISQLRNFRTPEGLKVKNAGRFSINGGSMESDDIVAELGREMHEELGLPMLQENPSAYTSYLGELADHPKGGKTHVFQVTRCYEALISIQSQSINMTPSQVASKVLNMEGMSRAALWKEDIEVLIRQRRMSPISVRAFKTYPALWPPCQPLA